MILSKILIFVLFIVFLLLLSILYEKVKRFQIYNLFNEKYIEKYIEKLQKPYPLHIAFIMDGNGRWATTKNKKRSYGHMMGHNNLFEIITDCFRNETKFLTFFVFAEQNWKRSKKEINIIFDVIYKKIKIINTELDNFNFRILVQGRLDRIPTKLRKLLERVQEKTKDREKTVIIAIDYSGRKEIVRACEKILSIKETLTVDNIQEKLQENLYVTNIPDPDLIIRTGGEKRISDFLLWQLCNSELYFTDVYWPDFDILEFKKAISDFHSRERRFGAVGIQV